MGFRSVLLLILLSILPRSATAQELEGVRAERFRPLHVGNFWIYGVTEQNGLQYTDGYLVNRIEGDTLIDGIARLIFSATELDASGTELSKSRCTFPYPYSGTPTITAHGGGTRHCVKQLVAFNLSPNQYRVDTPGQIRVGLTDYTVAANLYTGSSISIPGAGGAGQAWYRAADLGTYYYHEATSCTGCTTKAWTARLRYARVSGVYWGQSPGLAVNVDQHGEVPQVPQLQVYPNPATSGFHVDNGSALPTEVTVYDSLGRVVRSVTGTGRQFIPRGNLASGLYLVRNQTGSSKVVVIR